MKLRNVPSAFACLVLSLSASAQATWWVDAAAPPGGDGSAGAPFQRIQQGIDAASDEDGVRVLPGTYLENVDFLCKSIAVVSVAGAESTVIRGDQTRSVVRIKGVRPVLEGFTVENGAGNPIGGFTYGGGILFDDAEEGVVRDCVVRRNFATKGDGIAAWLATGYVFQTVIEDNGGPAYPGWCQSDDQGGGAWGNRAVYFDGCTFRNNRATIHGGGAFGVSLFGCTVSGNSAAEGAGVSDVEMYGGVIEENDARSCDDSYAAGGGAEDSTLYGTRVVGNEAWDDAGGAMDSALEGCVIRDNVVTSPIYGPAHGGGMLRCQATWCVVEGNSIAQGPWAQPGHGGGASGGWAMHTVFRGNSATFGSGVHGTNVDRCVVVDHAGEGVASADAINTIVRGNSVQIAGAGTVSYCDVEGGHSGPGNIDADPLFWDPANGDYHLQPISPCIDAGDPSQTDPYGTRVDIGAFFWNPIDCLAPVRYCPAGLSSDGCAPQISTLGTSRVSQSSGFVIRASSLPGQRSAALIYGVGGETLVPWGSRTFACVAPPRQRTGVASTGGSPGACDGELALDFDAWRAAHPFALGSPFSAGDCVWAQAWYRDPGAGPGSSFTGAVRFLTCP